MVESCRTLFKIRQNFSDFFKGFFHTVSEIRLCTKRKQEEKSMNIRLIGDKRTLLVNIDGELDHHLAGEVRDSVDRKIKSTNAINIIFDFSKVGFMDSSGLGVIMGRYKLSRLLGGKVIIFGSKKQTRRIIEMAGLDKIVKLCDKLEEALELV